MIRFDLSPTELDVVWRALRLDALPLVVDVPSPGATHAERAALERRVWTELAERELADDHGRPHWRLADRLETIARRTRSLELRVFGVDTTRAILATRGRRNVLGVLGERFTVSSAPATARATTLLALLPEVPPGQGHPVRVDTGLFAAAVRDDEPHDTLRHNGVSTDDARTLIAMATGSVRVAQIVAETRYPNGRAVRSRAMSVHDTPSGRYRSVRTVTPDSDHLTVTPATASALADALARLTPV
ncbi:ESX secretion-associated protein EspG [Actinophytocola sp.]|uniref:ESX secretion-associated protein EspG n=1 Tax=Actinophytocola sp. TaxID=1872138 RepID=UPI00389AAF76